MLILRAFFQLFLYGKSTGISTEVEVFFPVSGNESQRIIAHGHQWSCIATTRASGLGIDPPWNHSLGVLLQYTMPMGVVLIYMAFITCS